MHKFKTNHLGKKRWGLVRFDGETLEIFSSKEGSIYRYAVEFLQGADITVSKSGFTTYHIDTGMKPKLQGEVAEGQRDAAEALIAAINEAVAQRGP